LAGIGWNWLTTLAKVKSNNNSHQTVVTAVTVLTVVTVTARTTMVTLVAVVSDRVTVVTMVTVHHYVIAVTSLQVSHCHCQRLLKRSMHRDGFGNWRGCHSRGFFQVATGWE
jgi:hypothetical protein